MILSNRFIFFILSTFLLAGCGGGGSSSGSSTPQPTTTTIRGTVSKGPFLNGYVNSFKMTRSSTDSSVEFKNPYKTATITNGTYSIDFGTFPGGVVILEAYGTYKNEATPNGYVTLTTPLRAAVYISGPSGNIDVAITPLTELAVQYAEDHGMLSDQANINNANALVSDIFPFDIIATQPVKPVAIESGWLSATNEQKCYSMVLAGTSQTTTQTAQQNNQTVQNALFNLIDQYANELSASQRLANASVTTLDADTQTFLNAQNAANNHLYTTTSEIPLFPYVGYSTTQVEIWTDPGSSSVSTAKQIQLGLLLNTGMDVENSGGTPVAGVIEILIPTQTSGAYLTTAASGKPLLNLSFVNEAGMRTGHLATVNVRTAPSSSPIVTYTYNQEDSERLYVSNEGITPIDWSIILVPTSIYD